MSPPSSWQIKQVMSSALVKCRNTQIPQVVTSSRSHLATAPMAKWSAQMQLFTPTLVSRSELRSYSSHLWIFFWQNLSSSQSNPLPQFCDAGHVLHVVEVPQTRLKRSWRNILSGKFPLEKDLRYLLMLLQHLKELWSDSSGDAEPQTLHPTCSWWTGNVAPQTPHIGPSCLQYQAFLGRNFVRKTSSDKSAEDLLNASTIEE